MKTKISKNWHRVDNDNTQEVHLSDGKKFRAMVESMVWHRNQMDKIIRKAEDSGYFKGENVYDYLA